MARCERCSRHIPQTYEVNVVDEFELERHTSSTTGLLLGGPERVETPIIPNLVISVVSSV